MTENIETVVVEETPAVSPIDKFKTALKKVDPKVYAVAAVAAVGAVGFAAYKRIENFEEREAGRLAILETTDEV
ncbi:membrane protein [Gordonia phage Secretariat]|uniref:Membrane protein n=1 Tax=Gordonia phage Secretariat TaxID=2725616 RepID=A0A6M3SVP7_9CAUD|nr:membrane protein [Gordonia phage Secretariat]QJD49629.1 membrane protein [Gordonia phage Secretariat]